MAKESSQRPSRDLSQRPPHRVVVIVDENSNPFELSCAIEVFGLQPARTRP